MGKKVPQNVCLDALGITFLTIGIAQIEAANMGGGILLVAFGLIAVIAKYMLRVKSGSD